MSNFPDDPYSNHGRGPEDGYEDRYEARTQAPGMFLLIVGILSLLGACVELFLGVLVARIPLDDYSAMMDQQRETVRKVFPQVPVPEKGDVASEKAQAAGEGYFLGGLGAVSGILMILGGMKMRILQAYRLALIGSIVALIPCIGGCCLLGQIAGIWSLVVLMNPEIKQKFH